jgi:hypothetical protein
MNPSFRFSLLAGLLAANAFAAAANDAVLGRWALTIPSGAAGWLEIKKESGWYDGSILWGSGSVLPLASVTLAEGGATLTRVRDVERKDAAGKIVRKQQLTEVIVVRVEGDMLRATRTVPRDDGSSFEKAEFSGKRLPALPPRPDLAKVKFGEPIALTNGRDLSGWRLIEPNAENGWKIEGGALVNRPAPVVAGQPRRRFGNLRTDREFEDFNLTLEVKMPPGNNSGVYLRGLYEVQVLDSAGKKLDSHNMGAIYSRITPSVAAERPAGEWQSLDITLVARHVTVKLNGTTIIDNQPLLGVTGGALTSDESRPGPIYLQGDHGAVDFRNLVLRPVTP